MLFGTRAAITGGGESIMYAFDRLGMEHILADSITKNVRSQHVLKKLGFVYQYEKDGFKHYCLNRKEWNTIC